MAASISVNGQYHDTDRAGDVIAAEAWTKGLQNFEKSSICLIMIIISLL